jgi:alpha-glucosidase
MRTPSLRRTTSSGSTSSAKSGMLSTSSLIRVSNFLVTTTPSRASRTNRRRGWYIRADPSPDSGPPNNWTSQFGGSAWTLKPITGQYYLHSFLREQPDLNWRNPAVQEAMFDVLRFWLDRGVDGFRADAIWLLINDDQLRDNSPNPGYRPTQSDINRTLSATNPTLACDHPREAR